MSKHGKMPEKKFANYFEIGHNAFEFIMNFGQVYQGSDGAELCARIITSPTYAKALLRTLKEAVDRYEQTYGRVLE